MAKKNKKTKKTQDSDATVAKSSEKAVKMPPKFIIEEKLRTFLAVILFLLFLLLFASVAWYFITQLDSTFVSGGIGVIALQRFLGFL